MLNSNKPKLILIADRGRPDVSARLGFLASKIIKKKKFDSLILFEHKQKTENINIFSLFKIKNSNFIGLRFEEILLLIKTFIITIISIFRILTFGFDWFVKNFKIENVKLGDLIYDRYVRKGHEFINPSCFKIKFIDLLFKSIFKFYSVKKIFEKNDVRYSLIGSMTYISVSSILMRISQAQNVPVIYVSGESYRIVKKNEDVGDILSKFVKNTIKSLNQRKLKLESEKYFKKRIKGNLKSKKYDLRKYYQHDEQTWITAKNNDKFIKRIEKIKKDYSHIILYAPHNFAESNHRCGDLIFRDFYQQTEETLQFAKEKNNILWLFKIHPYSQKKYKELKIVKNIFYRYRSENILMVPFKSNNEKLFRLVDLVVSSRGTICLEAATFGVRNLINSDIFYDDGKVSIKAKSKKKYFNILSNVGSLKKIDKTTIIKAKKILYFRKKLQIENPYNLVTARKLINKKEFFNKLKKSIKEISLVNNKKNKMYVDIVNRI